jgi:hypothetical protein
LPQNSNEVIAGRDVLVYTEPYTAANTFPTVTAWGTAPGGAWVDQGYTKDGAHIQWRMQFQEYTVDQQLDPVARIPSQRDLRLRANLGQVDSAAMQVATGQGTTTVVAAGSGTRGTNTLVITGTIAANYYSTYFDVRSPVSGEAARIVGWQGRSVGDINIDFHIPDLAQVNLELALVPDTSVSPARIAQLQVILPALP